MTIERMKMEQLDRICGGTTEEFLELAKIAEYGGANIISKFRTAEGDAELLQIGCKLMSGFQESQLTAITAHSPRLATEKAKISMMTVKIIFLTKKLYKLLVVWSV